jgi:hypothetical protein
LAVADCGFVQMRQSKIRQSSNLPKPNNCRDIKTLNDNPRFSCVPNLNFPKTTLLEELIKHSLIFYFFWCKPDIIQKYVFEQNSTETCSKIINFFAYYQGLPIFLILQGFLQLDPNMSKKVYLPLSIFDFIIIYATSCIKPYGENWPVAVIVIISVHSFSIIFKFVAYFSA